jgi:hypothetical protein
MIFAMGTVHLPPPVQFFCALLLSPTITLDEVEETLVQRYGPIILRSSPISFTQTVYYDREMGPELTRVYIAFQFLMDLGEFAAVKHATNRLEALWTTPVGARRVNLDPGYLDLAKVVLASTKDHAHRVYIGAGIFAEVTLRYRHKSFQPWAWTYPDYRLPVTLAFFHQLRLLYTTSLRHAALPPRQSPPVVSER